MDCDAPGRRAADEIAESLDETADGDRGRGSVARARRRLRPHRPHPRAPAIPSERERPANTRDRCSFPIHPATQGRRHRIVPARPQIPDDHDYRQRRGRLHGAGARRNPRCRTRAARLRRLACRSPLERCGGPRFLACPDSRASRIMGGRPHSRTRERHRRLERRVPERLRHGGVGRGPGGTSNRRADRARHRRRDRTARCAARTIHHAPRRGPRRDIRICGAAGGFSRTSGTRGCSYIGCGARGRSRLGIRQR